MQLINTLTPCPECGSRDHLVVLNYDAKWHDGEVWCENIEEHKLKKRVYVRHYDAG